MTVTFSVPRFDLDYCLEQLLKHKPPRLLPPQTIEQLCHMLKTELLKEANIMSLQSPITIVGDIHGQFHDLLEIFEIGGTPPNTNYLFLGDYVDRGYYSIETILLLIVLKLRYPQRVHLIRGNHESRTITTNYGFYTEIVTKYGGNTEVWSHITDLFDYLPLGATIDGNIFATHGGLSPSCQQLDQVRALDRFREIPHDGIMADLVWSDPDPEIMDFKLSPRGAGYLFGYDIITKFCRENDLIQLVRAHQLCNEGYISYWGGQCLTVWSAPNYCYRCGNKASVLEITHSNMQSKTNTEKQQQVLPGQYFNVFDASPENDIDTESGKGVNGFITDENVNDSEIFADFFKSIHRGKQAEYFL
ncbi:putative serine/threonine protein phosphatase [Scheffersomyces spartinae]|uniref:Serine/threonine-protein phosphatase n=1 Tax=Scheffersomyces spartinae TaxID=45513 RepID=A0A9P8AGI1_9ASCO|nr:putative serine/threonine protein phosphatase [Scheffersomyces spartinae]KAG7191621.1 putative serine/threonine protein phosphatase [Scheffersomyces spartinae]